MAPFPHPAHRTGQADFPHPALGQDFTLARATPSAASEHLSELIGFPISRSFTTYCVCLELRSLPSTGITRLPRYYEPLRHPRAPSLSLTGFRLVIADHALGLPVFRALFASGWSGCRVGLAPTGKRHLVTAHAKNGSWVGRGRPEALDRPAELPENGINDLERDTTVQCFAMNASTFSLKAWGFSTSI